MIPIRDDAPRYTTPFVNYFLLALNVLVFLYELALPVRAANLLFFQFGVVPIKITALAQGHPDVTPEAALIPVLTSMFLHGGFLHLLSNMWVLYIFGDNIESYLGHFRYLLFYLVSGVAATIIHVLFNLQSEVPSVGASGAIAGVMGAYFVLFPSARVLTIMPFFFLFFLWLPAWIVLGYWFLAQFLSGAATTIAATTQSTGGVAFWAHVGGFLAGVALIKMVSSRRRLRYS
ncbi:MAG: rhomboid family intramembrane serine protease [Candidatus Korobacteraceae bacterium]